MLDHSLDMHKAFNTKSKWCWESQPVRATVWAPPHATNTTLSSIPSTGLGIQLVSELLGRPSFPSSVSPNVSSFPPAEKKFNHYSSVAGESERIHLFHLNLQIFC
jgi:hypothetical protein